MKIKRKKGFTIVELVIVIAVIGILAGILIPLFSGFITKSTITVDGFLVKELNNALSVDSVENGQHKTMHQALEATKQFGFDVSKINTKTKNNEILWDSANDVFCYLDEEEIKYVPETDLKVPADQVKDYQYFVIKSDVATSADLSEKYSTYLYKSTVTELTITKGLDVCDCKTIKTIVYNGGENNQDAIIRTNSTNTTLTIDDSTTGTVYHYGEAGELKIIQCHTSSYHENGNVTFAEIAKGRIVLENGSKIKHLHVDKKDNSSFDTIILTDNGAKQLPDRITRDKVDVSEAKVVLIVEQNGLSETIYVYPYTDADNIKTGTTEKTLTQNATVSSALGLLALDNGSDAGEKAMSNNEKEELEAQLVEEAQVAEIQKAIEDGANYVARIGATGYETLAKAVNAAVNGDKIVMLKNDTLTATVIISKTITIDLNGQTVGRTNIASAIGVNGGNLTINDSVGTGNILGNGQAVYTNAESDMLTINGGTLIGSTYGLRLVKGNTVTINGGIISGASYGIHNQALSKLNINGGNISGAYAINTKSPNGIINIFGGTLTGSSYGINNTATATINISGGNISATASNSYAIQNTASKSVITILNGTITGGNRAINTNKADSRITVSGGTINGGTYGIVSSGTLVINDGTIQASSYYTISNSGTLTVNGGTVIGGQHASYGRGIYNSTGTVIINGGTIRQEGQDMQVAVDNRKTLTINNGNIVSQRIGVYSTANMTMVGGNVTGDTQAIQNFGTLNITGGEINSENGTGINVAGGSLEITNCEINANSGYGIYGQGTSSIVINGADVSIDALKCIYLNSADSTCNISAGTFNGGSEVCYAQNGFFTISGGTFTGTGSSNVEDDIYRYTLNCLDASYSAETPTAGFNVTGGSFYQFNPVNNQAEGADTCFTPEGYHAEYNEETGYYTVVAD